MTFQMEHVLYRAPRLTLSTPSSLPASLCTGDSFLTVAQPRTLKSLWSLSLQHCTWPLFHKHTVYCSHQPVCTSVPLATPSSQAISQPSPCCPVFLTSAPGMFVLAPGLFGLALLVSPLISLFCFFLRHTLSFPCPSAVSSLSPRSLATKVTMPCVLVTYWMPLEMCT